jgi:hypothetical protein
MNLPAVLECSAQVLRLSFDQSPGGQRKAMSMTDIPIREKSGRARLPRWAVLILSIVLGAVGHVALPWVYSLLTVRHGWVQGCAGRWNVVGLSLVVSGIGGLLWCLGLHFARAPKTVELTYIFPSIGKLRGPGTDQAVSGEALESAPSSLVMEGPYKFSRHPMYLSVLALWLGWALFYGSGAVFIAWAVTWVGMTLFVVPAEERELEARFGESYLRYKNTVPRWVGKARR